MPKAFYRCEKCGREFKDINGAAQCESAHLTPVSAAVVSYTVRPFPYSIEITFNNGERRIYNAHDLGG